MGGFIPAIVAASLKKILGFKLVVTFHYRADKQFIIKYKYFFELVLIHTNHLFVVSKKQLHNFNRVFNKNFSNKISVISNGFDPKSFYPMEMTKIRKKLNLPEDKKIILNVGNLLEVKGQKYLIKAIKEVKVKIPNLLCVIIGDGTLRECLEKKVQDLRIEKYVKIIGARPHNEIPLWMNAADLFVLPSLNEGNPTVMFECLACGKPFVGTKVGGIPEIIFSEDYGLLCEPANPEELKENILQALSEEWDHKKILKYAEKFIWDNISKKILEIYSGGMG
jgi:glycosyltransferase involved in cell wall biosynthesis